jgi:hypothetical protein
MAHGDLAAGRATRPSGGPVLLSWVSKLGVWTWSFVGFVAATVIVVLALAAVSEIVLPLTFAAVLAVIFKPAVGTLRRHRFKPHHRRRPSRPRSARIDDWRPGRNCPWRDAADG